MKAFVLIYDIRGFSTAARRIPESVYGAFVAEAHALVLSTISFAKPQFVKNLGDGHLVIWESAPETQRVFLHRLIHACINAQREYRALVARQSFDGCEFLPKDLGFGISWGDITHEDDYYGNAINVAARLQDLARPRGVIIDESSYLLLPPDHNGKWEEPIIRESAILKGVGKVVFRRIARLTRREQWHRKSRRIGRRVAPLLLPLVLFFWIDAGLPFVHGNELRGQIDGLQMSYLRPWMTESKIHGKQEKLRQVLLNDIRRRFSRRLDRKDGSRDDRFFPSADFAPDFFAWTDGLAASALMTLPATKDASVIAERCLNKLFTVTHRSGNSERKEFLLGEGWMRHPAEPVPHFESTAWVLLGCVLAHGQPEFQKPARAERLRNWTSLAFDAFSQYFDETCRGWHWKLYQSSHNADGQDEFENQHYCSTYSTALAVWILTEAERLRVMEVVEPARKKALLQQSVRWLHRHYLGKPAGNLHDEDATLANWQTPFSGWVGWSAECYKGKGETKADYRDGLTLQILWTLMNADSVMPGAFPQELMENCYPKLLELQDRNSLYPTQRHSYVVTLTQFSKYSSFNGMLRGGPVRARDAVEFYWIPWAYAAVQTYEHQYAVTTRQKVELQRVLSHLLDRVDEAVSKASDAWIFEPCELYIGLSMGK